MSVNASGIFLSDMLGRPVISQSGRQFGKLHDLAMSPGNPLPVVHHILVKTRTGLSRVAWPWLAVFNQRFVSLRGEPESLPKAAEPAGEILMCRDILDKQIVDVDGARVVRVNDLKLARNKGGGLCLAAVDIGFRGILRRLGYLRAWDAVGGVFRRRLEPREIDWLLVQPLGDNLKQLTLTVTRDKLSDLHPADLANIISQLPHQDVPAVVGSLGVETAGEAIGEMEPEVSSRVLSQLGSEHAADVLGEMPPDDAADVLAELSDEKARELLGFMDPEDAEKVQELLGHEEDTAGGVMNNEFLSVPPGALVEDALRQVRALGAEVDDVYYVYVLDGAEHVQGVVSLKRLLLARGLTPVSEIMTRNLKTVRVDVSLEDVLELAVEYKLAAVPVLDGTDAMVGIVSADDLMEYFLPMALRWKQFRTARNF